MGPHPFYIVDVFAEEKYAGNQLAVFRGASGLSGTDMQRFAKEMNYSETTFILSETPYRGGYNVRIFTPQAEVPFAGHPTLGTAYVIQREIIQAPVETLTLNLQVGQIPVTLTYTGDTTDILWMQQQPPSFGATLDYHRMAQALSLDEQALDHAHPIQEVSTGLPFIIVPVKTLAAVKRAKIANDIYLQIIHETTAKAMLIFCPEAETPDHDLHVRVFAEYLGVPEDPATGSANGCLAGYLVRYRYFDSAGIDVRVEQGYEIGRPSRLYLRAHETKAGIDVRVGGKVVMVATGAFV